MKQVGLCVLGLCVLTLAIGGQRTMDQKKESFRVSQEGPLKSLAFAPDGALLASASNDGPDGTIKVFDVKTGGEVVSLELPGQRVRLVRFDPGSGRLAMCG